MAIGVPQSTASRIVRPRYAGPPNGVKHGLTFRLTGRVGLTLAGQERGVDAGYRRTVARPPNPCGAGTAGHEPARAGPGGRGVGEHDLADRDRQVPALGQYAVRVERTDRGLGLGG